MFSVVISKGRTALSPEGSSDGAAAIEAGDGRSFRVKAKIDMRGAKRFGLRVRIDPKTGECSEIVLDAERGVLEVRGAVSREAAELKHYECEYCGKFDGIVVPNLLAGNLICKFWDAHLHSYACGVLSGTTIPVAISGRSESPEHAFLSLAGSIARAE